MVVDCGGSTVDLTTHKLLGEELSEITERNRYHCGSSFVDKAFLDFIGERVGNSTMEEMKRNHYGQLQYIVQDFCRNAKLPFTGEKDFFGLYELDLDIAPVIRTYVKGENKKVMEESEWLIEIHFGQIKAMFDPVIEKIIDWIKKQLNRNQIGRAHV